MSRHSASFSLLLSFIWLLPAGGCARLWGRGEVQDPALESLQIGERLYQQRGSDPLLLDAAIDVWSTALAEHPQHPRLLARLTEAWTLRAETDPLRQPHDYDVARRYGIQCLLAEPAVSSVVVASGRLDARAVRLSSDVPCLAWTAIAWARWLALHGAAGAAIDLDTIENIARRAATLEQKSDGRIAPGLCQHALGLALALPPEPLQPDLDGAEQALLSALESAPSRWMIAVDLADQVYGRQAGRQGSGEALLTALLARELDQGSPDSYSNQAAQRRAAEILERGPQPRWAP